MRFKWKKMYLSLLTVSAFGLQVFGGVLHLWQRGPCGGALCQHHQEEADAPRGSVWGGGAAGGAGWGETVHAPSGLRPHLRHSGLPGIRPPADPAALHLRLAAGGVCWKRWVWTVWHLYFALVNWTTWIWWLRSENNSQMSWMRVHSCYIFMIFSSCFSRWNLRNTSNCLGGFSAVGFLMIVVAPCDETLSVLCTLLYKWSLNEDEVFSGIRYVNIVLIITEQTLDVLQLDWVMEENSRKVSFWFCNHPFCLYRHLEDPTGSEPRNKLIQWVWSNITQSSYLPSIFNPKVNLGLKTRICFRTP